jgi:hypothetical protein
MDKMPLASGDANRMSVTGPSPNVVLDGHQRLKACKELGFPATYNVKNFTGKPLEELRHVVSVNLHRRHQDEN